MSGLRFTEGPDPKPTEANRSLSSDFNMFWRRSSIYIKQREYGVGEYGEDYV